jgi:hypothetical protein
VGIYLIAAVALLPVLDRRVQAQSSTPAQSFLELQRMLTKGDPVTIVDWRNRAATGRVVSVSGDRIEIVSTRAGIMGLASQGRPFVFAEGDVRWIGREDGTWNGQLIGVGLGVAAAGIIVARTDSKRAAVSALIFLPPIGGGLGRNVDARHRRTLYRSPTAAFVIGPSIGPRSAGIMATVGF